MSESRQAIRAEAFKEAAAAIKFRNPPSKLRDDWNDAHDIGVARSEQAVLALIEMDKSAEGWKGEKK